MHCAAYYVSVNERVNRLHDGRKAVEPPLQVGMDIQGHIVLICESIAVGPISQWVLAQ